MSSPPPLGKVVVFPIVVATILAGLIAYLTPKVGPFAWMSAWIATFVVLTIWGVLHYDRDK